jgi:hypothetical protein
MVQVFFFAFGIWSLGAALKSLNATNSFSLRTPNGFNRRLMMVSLSVASVLEISLAVAPWRLLSQIVLSCIQDYIRINLCLCVLLWLDSSYRTAVFSSSKLQVRSISRWFTCGVPSLFLVVSQVTFTSVFAQTGEASLFPMIFTFIAVVCAIGVVIALLFTFKTQRSAGLNVQSISMLLASSALAVAGLSSTQAENFEGFNLYHCMQAITLMLIPLTNTAGKQVSFPRQVALASDNSESSDEPLTLRNEVESQTQLQEVLRASQV